MSKRTFEALESIEVDVDAAGISITAAEGSQTSVELVDRRGEPQPEFLELEQDGATLRVTVRTMREGRWRNRSSKIDLRLRVATPDDVAVTLHADAGGISVEDRDADVSARAHAGGIKLVRVRAAIEASTGAGGISLSETRGEATVSSDAGAIRVSDHRGDRLELRTKVGGAKADRLEVDTFVASTQVGAMQIAFATPPTSVDVTSAVGAVSVQLPEAEYEIEQVTGPLGRATLEGLTSTPGSARHVRIASTGVGAMKVSRA
jgi:DUF4097 and DUF4098 domain-containing protein YvlB